jgi:hypothetical protein
MRSVKRRRFVGCLKTMATVFMAKIIFARFAPLRERNEGLEPEKLKDMVRKDLAKSLAQYSTGPVSMKLMKEMRAI